GSGLRRFPFFVPDKNDNHSHEICQLKNPCPCVWPPLAERTAVICGKCGASGIYNGTQGPCCLPNSARGIRSPGGGGSPAPQPPVFHGARAQSSPVLPA